MAFDNGAASQTVTIGEDGYTELTLRSQGNLHQNGSAINLQRVAVYTQNVREYASVLSTDAFAQIAGMYAVALDPNAPPINIAGLENAGQLDFFAQHNIRFGLFNEAHAGILDFAWDAVNWILPLESFATVFQQLGYLAGIGNGEFEADVFIIALVDVVTVFPPAKPLAAFTRPLKALTKGLKNTNPRFMRYFAGALNGAVRKARKGDFDTLWNTLPFMVLAAQMWLDEDSRKGLEFLVSTVDSGDDVLSWIDYLALPADGWEGTEIPSVDPFGDEEPITQQSILSFFIADAHAQSRARRLAATAAGVALTRLSKLVTKGEAQNLPDALRIIRNEITAVNLTDVRRYLHSPAMMKSSAWLVTAAGARSLRGFVKGKTNARYSFPVIMATTAYLGWESACGTMIDMQEEQSQPGEEGAEPETPINLDDLQCGLGSSGATGLNGQVRTQVAKKLMLVFGDAAANPNLEEEPPNEDGRLELGGGGHGALFHLVQTAYFQARHRFAGQDPIKFMEKQRWVTIQKDEMIDDVDISSLCGKSGQACLSKRSRNVDIILGKANVKLNGRDYVQDGREKPETWIELKSWAAQSENGEGRYRFAFEKIPKVGPLAPWVVEGTKAKLNWTAHLQFSLDRAANNIGVSWLSASEAGSEGVRMQQAVGEFQWRFQAFKDVNKDTRALRAISPKLGDSSRASSFKYLVHKRPAVTSKAGFQESDIQDFSFASDARNFEQQAKFATLTELVPLIAQAGFAEITQHNDEPVDID